MQSQKLSLPQSAVAAHQSKAPLSKEERAARRARIAEAAARGGDAGASSSSGRGHGVHGHAGHGERGREWGKAGRSGGYAGGRDGERRGFGERRGERAGFGERRGRDDRRDGSGFGRDFRAESRRGERMGQGKPHGAWGASADERVIDLNEVFTSTVPVGRMVGLPVVEITDKGALLDGAEFGELFVPNSQLYAGLEAGDVVQVFIYQHSGRFLATAKHPYFELGQVGLLKVSAIEHETVYLDMGIPKELVLPRAEQRRQFKVGDKALVLMAIDAEGRLFATQCFHRYIRSKAKMHEFEAMQKVKIVPMAMTPMGYRTVVDDKVFGLLSRDNIHSEVQIGKRYEGYIAEVRDDGRVDVSLHKMGREGVLDAADVIIEALDEAAGRLNLGDNTDPEIINDLLHMSKRRFKQAIGALYKKDLIIIADDHIELTAKGRDYMSSHGSDASEDAGAR